MSANIIAYSVTMPKYHIKKIKLYILFICRGLTTSVIWNSYIELNYCSVKASPENNVELKFMFQSGRKEREK